MQIVHQLIPGALLALMRDQPLSAGKVAFAWRVAVGPALDRAGAIDLADDGVLAVRVTDARWVPEIARLAPVIRARLDTLLGAGIIRRIDVTQRAGRAKSSRPPR